MTAQVYKSNVVLFPLCDKSGVMQHALQPAASHSVGGRRHRSGTRPDAIVFAWVLDLPAQIDSTDAARAVLAVVRPQLSSLDTYQRSVVDELAKLMRTEESSLASIPAQKSSRRFRPNRRRVKELFNRQSRLVRSVKVEKLVCLPGGLDKSDKPSN